MSQPESSGLDEILLSLARIEKALKIMPDQDATITNYDSTIEGYQKFAKEELKLTDITIENQKSAILGYLSHSKGHINKNSVKTYVDSNESSTWKTNQLKALRRFIRDFLKLGNWIEEFKLEKSRAKVQKDLPSDPELIMFFNELSTQEKLVFILLHNTGLRLGEVLSLKVGNLNFKTNMIDASNIHQGQTKSSWISFFTAQTAQWLNQYINDNLLDIEDSIFSISARTVQYAFNNASFNLGLDITPHLLRRIFAQKCRQAGIDKDYINAFQGRMPQSVLAKHYTDYSPEALREEYDKVEPLLTLGK